MQQGVLGITQIIFGSSSDDVQLVHELSERCGITYQTEKNIVDGKGFSGKILVKIIEKFDIEERPDDLRDLLVYYIGVQLPDDVRDRYLTKSGLAHTR